MTAKQPPNSPIPPHRWFGGIRYLALIAVLGLTATTIATFCVAIAKTISLSSSVIGGAWKNELIIVKILEAIDTHLLAVVQLIVAIGLYELFIGDLAMPKWLEARSLEDLKKPIIDVLVVFVSIKGIERFLIAESALDSLYSVGAAALLIIPLTAFRALAKKPATPQRQPGNPSKPD